MRFITGQHFTLHYYSSQRWDWDQLGLCSCQTWIGKISSKKQKNGNKRSSKKVGLNVKLKYKMDKNMGSETLGRDTKVLASSGVYVCVCVCVRGVLSSK